MKVTPYIFSILLSLGILLGGSKSYTQGVNLGCVPVTNFSKQQYKAGTQIWDIAQGKNGLMWFANNDGLLEYDGAHWRRYPLGNGTIIRSVAVGADAKVYVGGQGDFGYFAPDHQGVLHYQSLKNKLPDTAQNFGDVWDVAVVQEGVFFRTDQQVFWYHADAVQCFFPPDHTLSFMGVWKQQLLVQDDQHRLYGFSNGQFQALAQPASFNHGTISGVFTLPGDTMLITTIKDGIFYATAQGFLPWTTQADAFLKNNRIYCAAMLPDGTLALGTSLNGLVTLDRQRRMVQHLNKKSGLQNNTILSLCALPKGGLWLGLDNGIDYVDLQSPFSTIYPDGDLQGTAYTVEIFNGKIYFGTNTGLYASDWKRYYKPDEKQHFNLVQHSEGQVWSLNLLDDQLLMGHHDGAFDIKGLRALPRTHLQGIWRFIRLTPEIAIAGHYNGFASFKKTGNGWVFDRPLLGFGESSRILALDHNHALWMAHPYRGIYRVAIDPEARTVNAAFFGAQQGLPSDMGNHLFKLDQKIVYTGERSVFDFDEAQNKFVPNPEFNALFGAKTQVKYLRQDAEGNIWYVTDAETGMLKVDNGPLGKKVRKIPIPELKDKLTSGFYHVLPVDAHNVFIATGQGFIHFDPAAYIDADTIMRMLLHAVFLEGDRDSLLFGGHDVLPAQNSVLSYLENALRFSFSAPDYPASELVQYCHLLKGLDKNWSDWSNETELAFNQLRPGKYTLLLKARNQHGTVSPEITYSFTILPPWYANSFAYLFYGLLLAGLMAGIIYRQRKRFEQEKQNLQDLHSHREAEHQRLAQRSEEAIVQLRNEKLETEVKFKTRELASVTMHLVQKNEILNTIREGLNKLQHKANAQPELEKDIQRMRKMVEHDATIDDDWEHFSQNFDQVYSDFLRRLGEQYAHLSPNDFRLCAYLRMNLSSKEIASLMNISIRGVEASRYRLRKRLDLDTETNLTEFLIRF